MHTKMKQICLTGLVIISPLMIACGQYQPGFSYNEPGKPTTSSPMSQSPSYNGDQSVSSYFSNAAEEPKLMLANEAMIIEGRIAEVMETWPLQLIVETHTGRYQVALQAETKIGKKGQGVGAGTLRHGLNVQIEGQRSGSTQSAMTARVIEVK